MINQQKKFMSFCYISAFASKARKVDIIPHKNSIVIFYSLADEDILINATFIDVPHPKYRIVGD